MSSISLYYTSSLLPLRATFEGEDFHKFRGFVAIRESFLHEIGGCGVLWHDKSEQFTKIFSAKIMFFTNL